MATVANNGEPTAASEGAALCQRTAGQGSGLEAHATQVTARDEPRVAEDSDQDRVSPLFDPDRVPPLLL